MIKILLTLFLFLSLNSFGQSDQFFIKVINPNSIHRLAEYNLIKNYSCPFRLPEMQTVFLIELTENVEIDNIRKWLIGKIGFEYIEEVPKIETFFTPNDLQT
jgi:hypothetical protein